MGESRRRCADSALLAKIRSDRVAALRGGYRDVRIALSVILGEVDRLGESVWITDEVVRKIVQGVMESNLATGNLGENRILSDYAGVPNPRPSRGSEAILVAITTPVGFGTVEDYLAKLSGQPGGTPEAIALAVETGQRWAFDLVDITFRIKMEYHGVYDLSRCNGITVKETFPPTEGIVGVYAKGSLRTWISCLVKTFDAEGASADIRSALVEHFPLVGRATKGFTVIP